MNDFFSTFFKMFSLLAGGRCLPDPLIFGWGRESSPRTPPWTAILSISQTLNPFEIQRDFRNPFEKSLCLLSPKGFAFAKGIFYFSKGFLGLQSDFLTSKGISKMAWLLKDWESGSMGCRKNLEKIEEAFQENVCIQTIVIQTSGALGMICGWLCKHSSRSHRRQNIRFKDLFARSRIQFLR